MTQGGEILPLGKQMKSLVCGNFLISPKRPKIEGSFLMWFTKIMFLVRTFNVTETVPHPVYLRNEVQSTEVKFTLNKIIKFMLGVITTSC